MTEEERLIYLEQQRLAEDEAKKKKEDLLAQYLKVVLLSISVVCYPEASKQWGPRQGGAFFAGALAESPSKFRSFGISLPSTYICTQSNTTISIV